MIANRAAVTGGEEELFGSLSQCEERYRRAGRYPGEFATDVEAWVDRQAGGST
jgi:hypothetical protein